MLDTEEQDLKKIDLRMSIVERSFKIVVIIAAGVVWTYDKIT